MQIHVELCDVCVDDYVSYTTVAEWNHRVKEGRTSLDDNPRIGPLVTEATDKNIEAIRAFIDENPHISIRHIVFEIGLPYDNINRLFMMNQNGKSYVPDEYHMNQQKNTSNNE